MGYIADKLKDTTDVSTLVKEQPSKKEDKFLVGKFFEGGLVSKLGDILNIGQYFQVGATETFLEKIGYLKADDKQKSIFQGAIEGIKGRASNIDLLKRIGEERFSKSAEKQISMSGLLTGQYKPSTSVVWNFVREVPSVTAGLMLDIFLDPNPLGKISRMFRIPARALIDTISDNVGNLAKTNPKLHQTILKTGRFLISKNFGNPKDFVELETARKVAEEEGRRAITEISDVILKLPKPFQKRLTQIRRGSISVSDNERILRNIVDIAGKEIDAAGGIISQTSPQLLARSVYEANRGKHIPRFYEKHEFPDVEKELKSIFQVGFPAREATIRVSQFKPRKDFAVNTLGIDEGIYDEAQKLLDKIAKLEKQAEELIQKQKDKKTLSKFLAKTRKIADAKKISPTARFPVERQIARLGVKIGMLEKEIDKLGGKRVRLLNDIEGFFILPASKKMIIRNAILSGKEIEDPRLNKIAKNVGEFFREDNTISINEFFAQNSLRRFDEFYNQKVRQKLGEIHDFGFLFGRGATRLRIAAERVKFFDQVAKKFAKDYDGVNVLDGYVPVPKSKAYGNLAGKQVPTPIALTLAENVKEFDNPAWNTYLKLLQTWKIMKVAPPFTFSTSARNIATNYFFLQPLGGVPIYRLDLYAKAAKNWGKGKLWHLAEKNGLSLTSVQRNELNFRLKKFYEESSIAKELFPTFQKFFDTSAKWYGNQDKFFKFVHFIKKHTEDGLPPAQAMREANFYLVNYADMPGFIDWLRKSPLGLPFVSFTFGVAKPIAKTLLENPEKLAKWFKVIYAINRLDPNKEGPYYIAYERQSLPDRIKNGMYIRLPIKDKFNRSLYLDLDYILPLNIIEPTTFIGENPGFAAIELGRALISGHAPIDSFSGQPIWDETDTLFEKVAKATDYLQKAILPVWSPGIPVKVEGERKIGGYALEETMRAIKGEPESRRVGAKPQSLLRSLFANFLGLRTTPIDSNVERNFRLIERQRKINELLSKMKSIFLNVRLTPEEKAIQYQRIMKKIQKILSTE